MLNGGSREHHHVAVGLKGSGEFPGDGSGFDAKGRSSVAAEEDWLLGCFRGRQGRR